MLQVWMGSEDEEYLFLISLFCLLVMIIIWGLLFFQEFFFLSLQCLLGFVRGAWRYNSTLSIWFVRIAVYDIIMWSYYMGNQENVVPLCGDTGVHDNFSLFWMIIVMQVLSEPVVWPGPWFNFTTYSHFVMRTCGFPSLIISFVYFNDKMFLCRLHYWWYFFYWIL